MKTRRGSLLNGSTFGDAILMYKPGDVVKPVVVTDQFFTGVVRDVDLKINKVTVAWGGGPVSQHDPDEIMPMPFFGAAHKDGNSKIASRRMRADVDDLLNDLVAGKTPGVPDGTGPYGWRNRKKDQSCPVKKAQHLENVKDVGMMNDREIVRALRDAVIAEEQAINQYETIADAAGNSMVREVVQDIANEEKVHVGELQRLLSMLLDDEQGFLDEGADEVEGEKKAADEDEQGGGMRLRKRDLSCQDREADTGSGILLIDNDLRDRSPIVKTAGVGGKDYNIMENVGRSRYVVNYHDGVKTHGDGSKFYDVKIFGNKVDLEKFEKELKRKGYKEASSKTATNPSMDQFCGEPDTHGLDVPVSGGTSVMKDLAYQLHDEANEFADIDPRFTGIKAGLKEMAREVNASDSFDVNSFLKTATIFRPGDEVVFTGGGVRNGQTGVVVPIRMIPTDGRGIPRVNQGHYKPIEQGDVAVKYDDGDLDVVKERWISRTATSGDEPSAQRTIEEETAKKSSVLAADDRPLKCNRCGKTLPPIKGYEGSKWRHCPCGGVATRKASICGMLELDGLRSRRAMYWCAPDRTFRLTQQEQEQGIHTCPKCRIEMNREKFTRSDKLLICPQCGFKVPTSKAVTQIEVKVPEGVSVEVTKTDEQGNEVGGQNIPASMGRRGSRIAYADPQQLADLPRMTLDQISSLIYKDWKNVNYAAKPYLQAMATLRNVSDNYMMDSGTSIVTYFLSNSSGWRGDVAKAIKKELQRRIR